MIGDRYEFASVLTHIDVRTVDPSCTLDGSTDQIPVFLTNPVITSKF